MSPIGWICERLVSSWWHCPRKAVMEEMCHWGQVLRVHNFTILLVCALCFRFVVEDVGPQFPVPATIWSIKGLTLTDKH